MSKFKNLTEKNMRFLLKRMNNDINEYGKPTELVSGLNKKIVKKILDDIGMVAETKDFSFIFSLYQINPNYETEPIKIPELHTYEVTTKRYASILVREYWKNTVENYLEDEYNVQEFIDWFDYPEAFEWWDGEMIDRDQYDEETTDTDIDEINKIS
jgi:hypothetical protein